MIRWDNMTAVEIAKRMVVGVWYDTSLINESVPACRSTIDHMLRKMGA